MHVMTSSGCLGEIYQDVDGKRMRGKIAEGKQRKRVFMKNLFNLR